MSEIAEIFDSVESKIQKLLKINDSFDKDLRAHQAELNNATTIINKQKSEIEALKKECESLRMANSLLGSEENKRDTKLKINSLIREIDYCIAQLSE